MIYKIISDYKWFFVDNIIENDRLFIPLTKETFYNYKYCIDWSQIILQNEKTGYKIPENVIEWITDVQDLEMISSYQKFSSNFIKFSLKYSP